MKKIFILFLGMCLFLGFAAIAEDFEILQKQVLPPAPKEQQKLPPQQQFQLRDEYEEKIITKEAEIIQVKPVNQGAPPLQMGPTSPGAQPVQIKPTIPGTESLQIMPKASGTQPIEAKPQLINNDPFGDGEGNSLNFVSDLKIFGTTGIINMVPQKDFFNRLGGIPKFKTGAQKAEDMKQFSPQTGGTGIPMKGLVVKDQIMPSNMTMQYVFEDISSVNKGNTTCTYRTFPANDYIFPNGAQKPIFTLFLDFEIRFDNAMNLPVNLEIMKDWVNVGCLVYYEYQAINLLAILHPKDKRMDPHSDKYYQGVGEKHREGENTAPRDVRKYGLRLIEDIQKQAYSSIIGNWVVVPYDMTDAKGKVYQELSNAKIHFVLFDLEKDKLISDYVYTINLKDMLVHYNKVREEIKQRYPNVDNYNKHLDWRIEKTFIIRVTP